MRRTTGPYRRRASVYIALLGVSMVVTVIGLSALTAARIQRYAAEATNDIAEARFYAQSATDLALFRISGDPQWRYRYSNDVWTTDQAIGRGTFSFKLVDELDGSLTNDPGQPVRLYAMGCVGDAVRIHSVLLESGEIVNLLSNPAMENGTVDWFPAWGCCTIASDPSDPHSGAASIAVTSRWASWAGPAQDLTAKITSGTTYRTEVWARMVSGNAPVCIAIYTNSSGSGQSWAQIQAAISVGTEWTKVEGTVTPTWSGDLSEAKWYVKTTSGTADFNIDDALFVESDAGDPAAMKPVPGSWQRVTLP